MPPHVNRQVRLKSRPTGIPQADHFEIVEAPVPDVGPGQVLIRNEYLSVEPAMCSWVSASANYSTPVGIGEVMRAFSAGTVMASRHRGYAEGDWVMGMLGWQEYALSDGSSITRKVKEADQPLSLALGVLGLNGVTAYFGLIDIGQPRPGDTVVFPRRPVQSDPRSDKLLNSWAAGRLVLPEARSRHSSAARNSATTPQSTTRPTRI